MRTRFAFTLMVGLAALLWATAPAVGASSPLLSGYGGPGQGTQAILGSALLNGPPAGGGGGAAGAGAAAATTVGGGSPLGRSSRDRPTRPRRPGARALPTVPAPTAIGVAHTSLRPASDPLGLSGIDFVFIALSIGVLTCVGFSTRWLARGIGHQGIDG